MGTVPEQNSNISKIDGFCPHEDQIKIVKMLVDFYKNSQKKMMIPEHLYEQLVAAKFKRGNELEGHSKEVLKHVET